MRKKQQGFTLLEIMMVTIIAAVLAMIAFQEATLQAEQQRARALGGELLKFNNGVRDYVSYYAGDAAYASKVGTKTGVNWLKSTTCGGEIPKTVANDGFVPCAFLEDSNQLTSYGRLTFTTEVTTSAPHILNTKTTMSELKIAKKVRGDLSGLAAIVAGSASQLSFTPTIRTTDGTARFCITEKVAQCQGSLGRILMFTSNDASDDTWLRTDGSNTMNNNIKFLAGNPDESREIQNISKLYNVGGPLLTLGNKTGSLPTFLNSGIVVDSDAEIMGTLYADKMVDRNNSNYYVDPSDQSRFNLVNAEGLTVTNNIVAGGTVTAKQFIDGDNAAFYVDPDKDSKLHTITTSGITGEGGSQQMTITGQANVDNLKVRMKNSTDYVSLLDLLPTYVAKDAWAVQSGSVVDKPSCGSGGEAKIIISPMNMESSDNFQVSLNLTAGESTSTTLSGTTSGRSYMYATNNGGSWTVIGGTANGSANTGFGVAQTYCAY
jgi:prepilin-type N-terminal cleavage/methylation domain-containing protein